MRNPGFPTQVRQRFDFLFVNYGFIVKEQKYTGFAFSEWLVELCSDELCVRVSIDKSQVLIDVGVPSKEVKWLDLMYIMMYSTQDTSRWKYLQLNGEINEEFYDKQLAHLSEIFKENFAQIKRTVISIDGNQREKKSFNSFLRKHSK